MRSRMASDSGFSSDSPETYDRFVPAAVTFRKQVGKMEQKVNEIKSAREKFLEEFLFTNSRIDGMSREISVFVQAREQTLKKVVEEIRDSKIEEWDRQLDLCQEAMANLLHVGDSFEAIGNVQALSWNFGKKIGLIDGGDIKPQMKSGFPWRELEKLEKLLEGPVTVEKQQEKPKPKFVIQIKGKERLHHPWGVCSDSTGRILVTDYGNHRIQVFNEFGDFLFRFGKLGTEPGEFKSPTGIVVDKKCRILVADMNNHRVQVFTFNGGFLLSFGVRGTAPGEFLQPWDVAVNEDGLIAVSDTQNHRIQLFNTYGEFLAKFGFDIFPRFKVCPRGIAFKSDGTLMMIDSYNNSILLIDRDFSTISKFNDSNFSKPQAVTSMFGLTAIADSTNQVQVYDGFGYRTKSFGGWGRKRKLFASVQGICFQPNGNLVVADFWNNRILVF